MPKVSEFFGITIYFYYRDHEPPHFHARYAEHEALIAIESLEVLRGRLPPRAQNLVMEWAIAHRPELRQAWQLARLMQPLPWIEPLQ